MTHIADYTTEDLAAGILGLHDRPHKEMVAIATKAINAAIAAAVQAERERCAEAARDCFFDLTDTSTMSAPDVIKRTRYGIAAAIRARSNGEVSK